MGWFISTCGNLDLHPSAKDRDTAWETVILVPTDQPLKAFARAFLPLLEPSMGEVDRLVEATKLADHF